MSLVINSNEGGAGYEFSNQELNGKYPDFNQILLKPNFGKNQNGGGGQFNNTRMENSYSLISNSNYTNGISVNGTPINFICEDMLKPDYMKGGHLGEGIGQCGVIGPSNTNYSEFRIGTMGTLPAGKTIGKQIYRPYFLLDTTYSTSSSENCTITFGLKIGLLHSDGTIDYISETTILDGTVIFRTLFRQPNNASYQYLGYKGTVDISTNGIVSQEGDRIIADISFTSTVYYMGVVFGYMSGTESYLGEYQYQNVRRPRVSFKPRPIQISIE